MKMRTPNAAVKSKKEEEERQIFVLFFDFALNLIEIKEKIIHLLRYYDKVDFKDLLRKILKEE